MGNVLKTKLVKIGNSRGIRIPKPFLMAAGIDMDVEVFVQEDSLVIRPAFRPRSGWDEQFRQMAHNGDDRLPEWEAYIPTHFDEKEWEW